MVGDHEPFTATVTTKVPLSPLLGSGSIFLEATTTIHGNVSP